MSELGVTDKMAELITLSPTFRLEFDVWLEAYVGQDEFSRLATIPESLLTECYDADYQAYLKIWLKQRTETLMTEVSGSTPHYRFRRRR